MEQKLIVRDFVDSLRKIKPPVVNAKLLRRYLVDIVTDIDSLQEFIVYTDRFLRSSQTFQIGFLLHSLASVLMYHPLGSPVKQVKSSISTDVIHMSYQESKEIAALPEAKKYNDFCEQLMELESESAKILDGRIVEGRKVKEKIDDGTREEVITSLFEPNNN